MKQLFTLLFVVFGLTAFGQSSADKAAVESAVKQYTFDVEKKAKQNTGVYARYDERRLGYVVKIGKKEGNTITASISDKNTVIFDSVILEERNGVWTVISATRTQQ